MVRRHVAHETCQKTIGFVQKIAARTGSRGGAQVSPEGNLTAWTSTSGWGASTGVTSRPRVARRQEKGRQRWQVARRGGVHENKWTAVNSSKFEPAASICEWFAGCHCTQRIISSPKWNVCDGRKVASARPEEPFAETDLNAVDFK